jgi:hypothetical protein
VKLLDRLVAGLLLVAITAALLPALVSPLTTVAIVFTVCFVIVSLARYLASRW